MASEASLSFFECLKSRGSILGLDNMGRLVKELNCPDKELKIIHIAGTNGKGSVSSYISHILEEANYRVGSFNSPELLRVNECFRINNKEISDKELDELIEAIKPILHRLQGCGVYPTYFEVLVAMSMLYFRNQGVDFVVLEVGLGGRMDATNIIETPILSVITKIGVDHIRILGNSISEIAYEKAGIIKKYIPVISFEQEEEAMNIIQTVACENDSSLVKVSMKDVERDRVDREVSCFEYKGNQYKIQMLGRHQIENAIIAIEAVNALPTKIEDSFIKKGLYQTKWYGRMELIHNEPDIYIDGAHNVDGIKCLKNMLRVLNYKKYIGIIGMLSDKQVDEMLEIIVPSFDKLVVTEPDNQRALKAGMLCEKLASYKIEVIVEPDRQKATKIALELASQTKDEAIIAFGSLYMIGEIRKAIRDKKVITISNSLLVETQKRNRCEKTGG